MKFIACRVLIVTVLLLSQEAAGMSRLRHSFHNPLTIQTVVLHDKSIFARSLFSYNRHCIASAGKMLLGVVITGGAARYALEYRKEKEAQITNLENHLQECKKRITEMERAERERKKEKEQKKKRELQEQVKWQLGPDTIQEGSGFGGMGV